MPDATVRPDLVSSKPCFLASKAEGSVNPARTQRPRPTTGFPLKCGVPGKEGEGVSVRHLDLKDLSRSGNDRRAMETKVRPPVKN